MHYPLFAAYVLISVSSAQNMDYIHFENAQFVYRLIWDSLCIFEEKKKQELLSYKIKIIVVALVCLCLLLPLLYSMLLLIFLFSWCFFSTSLPTTISETFTDELLLLVLRFDDAFAFGCVFYIFSPFFFFFFEFSIFASSFLAWIHCT